MYTVVGPPVGGAPSAPAGEEPLLTGGRTGRTGRADLILAHAQLDLTHRDLEHPISIQSGA